MSSRSIHIAAPDAGPACATGLQRLKGPPGDARLMAAIAARQRFEVTPPLIGAAATRDAVLRAVEDAARAVRARETVLITFSGHGRQYWNTNPGEEMRDGMDEAWCLADRSLLDDDLRACWTRFHPDARIVVVSDSCNSGTVSHIPLDGVAPSATDPDPAASRSFTPAPRTLPPAASGSGTDANVLLLAACADNQLAADGEPNSLFTRVLHEEWEKGAASYAVLMQKVHARVSSAQPGQHPRWWGVGAHLQALVEERPFTAYR